MPSFGDQIKASLSAHRSVSFLEDEARQRIAESFDLWDQGDLNSRTVRYALEAVVRSTYRSSAAIAQGLAIEQFEVPGWKPSKTVFNTDYLKDLISDIRKNLREYKASDRTEKDRRRAVLRMQLSASVAAQRGYTDSLIASYSEIEDFGYRVRKIWINSLNGNLPCSDCRKLHGAEVGLHENFPVPTLSKLRVYKNLMGPPRHPNCRCKIAILIVRLENALDPLDLENPRPAPAEMDTDEVKSLTWRIFSGIIKALKKLLSYLIKG